MLLLHSSDQPLIWADQFRLGLTCQKHVKCREEVIVWSTQIMTSVDDLLLAIVHFGRDA